MARSTLLTRFLGAIRSRGTLCSEAWQAPGGLRVSSRSGSRRKGGARFAAARVGPRGPVVGSGGPMSGGSYMGPGRPRQSAQVGSVGPAFVPLRNSPQPTIMYFWVTACFCAPWESQVPPQSFFFSFHWPILVGPTSEPLCNQFGYINPPGIHDSTGNCDELPHMTLI